MDTHAHIAPDVTSRQLDALGDAVIFAMTRNISEARAASIRRDPNIVWGLGIHPAVPEALKSYDADLFARAIGHFALVGEVGLDRRGAAGPQKEAFLSILHIASSEPLLMSIHSTGRTRETLDCLEQHPQRGAILHWFMGSPAEMERAAELGCYFSVNAAMSPETLTVIPRDRLLTETDFPSSRKKTQAKVPGDTAAIENMLIATHGLTDPRRTVRQNLHRLITTSGAHERVSADLLERISV